MSLPCPSLDGYLNVSSQGGHQTLHLCQAAPEEQRRSIYMVCEGVLVIS